MRPSMPWSAKGRSASHCPPAQPGPQYCSPPGARGLADELLVGLCADLPRILEPFKPYLHQRWAEGGTVARRLFEGLRRRARPAEVHPYGR
jgi:hypothetical protein